MTDMRSATRALDVIDCPLDGVSLIEASAGTGKTWNICALYLRLVLERSLKVSEILVVTFTNAATAELRERIRQRLVQTRRQLAQEAGAVQDEFVNELLRRLRAAGDAAPSEAQMRDSIDAALAGFDEASIFTIHGFCQRALADSAFAAQIPLVSELLPDDTSLREQVIHDFWRRRIASGQTPDPLLRYLLSRRDSPRSHGQLLARALARPRARTLWPQGVERLQALAADELLQAYAQAAQIWGAQRDDIQALLGASLQALKGNIYKPDRIGDASLAAEACFASADPFYLQGRKPEDKEISALRLLSARKLHDSTKKAETPPAHPFFEAMQQLFDLVQIVDRELGLARAALLQQMLAECSAALRDEKARLHLVGYDDMLQNLHRRLHSGQSPWLADQLRRRFPVALIDEFQDTDPVQWEIFSSIYASGTSPSSGPMFLVGDPKQAIYGFRSADLHTYLNARGSAGHHYTLERNQRSRSALVEALNRLFEANPSVFMLEGLDYRRVTSADRPDQVLHDPASSAALQIWLLAQGQGESQSPAVEQARRDSAQAVSAEIARMLAPADQQQVRIGERNLRAADIAVLVRTHAEGARMRAALAQHGVGSVERSTQSVFLTPQAEQIEQVLAAVLEPTRDGLLRCALATDAIGMNAAQIRALDADEAGASALAQQFAALRHDWQERGVGYMLRRWLQQHQVAERLLARVDGERQLTNLLHLIEILHQASALHASADSLLRWLRTQRSNPDAGEQTLLRLESDENLVQIVTIHASKGLEYPVVFCPFLWRDPAAGQDQLEGSVYHDERGELLIDFRKGLDDAFDEDAVKLHEWLERAAEFQRLVYVALTRAVHRCVLVAGCHGKARSQKSVTNTLLNWIVAGAGANPAQWRDSPPTLEQVHAAWHALAAASSGSIAVSPMPAGAGQAQQLPTAQTGDFAALAAPARIPSGWRIGSFSSLAHGLVDEKSAPDRDLRAESAASQDLTAAVLSPDDILQFARGARAGECLHALLESIDFTEPDGWQPVMTAALRRFGHPPDAQPMLASLLRDLLATPLPVGTTNPFRLDRLDRSRRLTELEFYLPSAGLQDQRLNQLLEAEGYGLGRFGFAPLTGFLKGFIDLVFEHDGRYFVLDWKSNHLGNRIADYDRQSMADEMTRHGYQLQALLYCVALHRYLGSRLADYDPQRHFGGWIYLFVRAVRPGWLLPDGTPAGVVFERPTPALLEQLSSLFDMRAQHA